MSRSAAEYVQSLCSDNSEWVNKLINEKWTNRRLVFRGNEFEFTKDEFLNALNTTTMSKKKTIEPGTPEGVGIAWVHPLEKLKQDIAEAQSDGGKIYFTSPRDEPAYPYPHSGIDHPLFLTIDGQTVFHKIVLFLKKNGNWDDTYLEMIAAASATYQNYCLAQKQVNEFGTTTETGAGGLKKNPAVDIASASFRDFMTFSNKFGLNPLFENKVSNKNADDESEI